MEPHPCGNTRKGVMGFSWRISYRSVQSVSLAPHSSPVGVGSCRTFISKAGLRGVRHFPTRVSGKDGIQTHISLNTCFVFFLLLGFFFF